MPASSLQRSLLEWFDAHRRDLPWRVARSAPPGARPPAYGVLVSEAMLQQTQVAAVVPYFHRFMAALPTIEALAAADEQVVLRLWQGLGYYSRARNLRKAAGRVVEQFGGVVPATVDELLTLPGVGRYTAGAIASIAYDTPAPILDGNVVRVLCRLDRIEDDPRLPAVRDRLWVRAGEIVPVLRAGDFNQSLMELGATICTPKNPSCLLCPVRRFCRAADAGVQESIPKPRPAKATPLLRRWVVCVRRADGDAYLIEQRPATGRWAGLWQFPTLEADLTTPGAATLSAALAMPLSDVRPLTTVRHALTHRQYVFDAFVAVAADAPVAAPRAWATLAEMDALPFSKPQLAIRRALADSAGQ
ncbi:MAG TPA: A/G-specific adenine glycosylase [Tepidisphaeraceae bacterium]